MDLLQFQDITRQKSEEKAIKLKGLIFFIDGTLGRQRRIQRQRSFAQHIDQAGLVPDADKGKIGQILAEYRPERM